MFAFLRTNPAERLRTQYHTKLAEALFAERHGKLDKSSMLSAQAEDLRQQLSALETSGEPTKH